MLNTVYKFITLSFKEKMLFIEAFYTLGIMKIAINKKPLKNITKDLKHHKGYKKKHTVDSDININLAISIGDIVKKTSRYTPWESACLVQSLTTVKMLRKRKIPSIFYLGVHKTKDDIKAHSWSVIEDHILTGASGHENFTVVSSIESITKDKK